MLTFEEKARSGNPVTSIAFPVMLQVAPVMLLEQVGAGLDVPRVGYADGRVNLIFEPVGILAWVEKDNCEVTLAALALSEVEVSNGDITTLAISPRSV